MRTNNKRTGEYTLLGNKSLNNLEKKFDYIEVISSPLLLVSLAVLIAGFVAISVL